MSVKSDYAALLNHYGVELGVGDEVGLKWEIMQNPSEWAVFAAFCEAEGVRTVLELGTGRTGGLARFMAECHGWRVTSVDINIPTFYPTEGVEFIQGTTSAVYPFLRHRLYDLVLIDASHTYDDVKADHEHYAHMGRIVALHDIGPGRKCCEGVARYWNEIKDQYDTHETIGTHKGAGIGWYINPDQHAKPLYFDATCEPLPDKTPDITVVTGTYNRLSLLQKMVESARASVPTGIHLDFVLVDNGSTDGTPDWITEQPDCTLVQMGVLVGANRALTEGAIRATGRYVLTGNDDIEFVGDALYQALVYLETHTDKGGVALAFKRPNEAEYHVNYQPAWEGDQRIAIPYAQIGLIRRELGNEAGWWGADDETFGAWSYGGDNYLTSRLWEMGYPVHALMTARFNDHLPSDELRAKTKVTLSTRPKTDQQIYAERYPAGTPRFKATPTQTIPREALRILYAPIYAEDKPVLYRERYAWRHSLEKLGICVEVDYRGLLRRQGAGVMEQVLKAVVSGFKPHILFTQVHSPQGLTAAVLSRLRKLHPSMVVVNYNADESAHLAKDRDAIHYMQMVDLQLSVNLSLCAWQVQHGITAAYVPQATEIVTPDTTQPCHDVVFLGNAYIAQGSVRNERAEIERDLRAALPDVNFGFYGFGWKRAAGNNHHHWSAQYGVYQNAKLAIVENMYQGRAYAYVSERFYNALKFGQCILWKPCHGAETFLGVKAWEHYIPWETTEDLAEKIALYLSPKKNRERLAIGKRARAFALKHHNYDVRTRWMLDALSLVKKK